MRILITLSILFVVAKSANCAESAAYQYDALGRMIRAEHSGSINNGLLLGFALDALGNRLSYTVTGSTGGGVPDAPVVVVPLNGYTIIPIEPQ